LAVDVPFRIIGYTGEPETEVGCLLWSGVDPQRYFKHGASAAEDKGAYTHLLTLDYVGQVVLWNSAQSNEQGRDWVEASPERIERLNRQIRGGEPLRYRQELPSTSASA
jgi:hypothetical protein